VYMVSRVEPRPGKRILNKDAKGNPCSKKKKDMGTVRIYTAMGGGHTAKNIGGQVAKYCMEENNNVNELDKWTARRVIGRL
jgi:hypothetical protein